MSDINYFYDVNGEYFTRKYKQNNSKKPLPENKKIIETLLNAGNKNSLDDSTLVRDMREIDKKGQLLKWLAKPIKLPFWIFDSSNF